MTEPVARRPTSQKLLPAPTRRRFLAGVGATTLVGPSALVAVAARGAETRPPSELLAYYPSAFRKSIEKFVIPAMKERYNITVKGTPRLSGEALIKAISQKDHPDVTVFMLDEGPWIQGKEAGVWRKLDGAQVPNLAKIPPRYKDKDGFGTGYALYMLGVLYDTEAYTRANLPKPESLLDLWHPGLKGRVTVQSFSSTFAFAFLTRITEMEGGNPAQSFDPGFAKIRTLRPNIVVFHGAAAQLNQLFQQKQVWAAHAGSYVAQQLAAAGLPLAWVAPREGGTAIAAYAAIANNAPNVEGAHLFLNLVLSEEYQRVFAETDFGVPVNPLTRLDPASFPVTTAMVERARQVPWAIYNAKRTELNSRWQREIESK